MSGGRPAPARHDTPGFNARLEIAMLPPCCPAQCTTCSGNASKPSQLVMDGHGQEFAMLAIQVSHRFTCYHTICNPPTSSNICTCWFRFIDLGNVVFWVSHRRLGLPSAIPRTETVASECRQAVANPRGAQHQQLPHHHMPPLRHPRLCLPKSANISPTDS